MSDFSQEPQKIEKLGLGALEADWKERRKKEEEERLRLEAEEQKRQQQEQNEKQNITAAYVHEALRDYNEEKVYAEEKKNTLSTTYKDDMERLSKLAAGEDYTDSKTGSVIPRENKKKLGIFTKKEADNDYKERIKTDLDKRYQDSLANTDDRLRYKKGKYEAYKRMETTGTIELTQIKDNYSEQLRRATKKVLLDMVNNHKDKYKKDDPLYKLFETFFESVSKYCREKGEVDILVRDNKTKTTYKSKKYDEIDNFIAMKKNLAKIKEQATALCSGDVKMYSDILFTIKGYEDTLHSMADGSLMVPHDAEMTRVGDKVYDDAGKRVETNDLSGAPLFAHDPTVHDVIQGDVGDCFLVSSLGAMASADPSSIKKSMKDNGSTVIVRLYKPTITDKGIKKVPMYFEVPKHTLGRNGGANALWVNCIEYAYIGYRMDKKSRQNAIKELEDRLSGADKAGMASQRERIKTNFKDDVDKYYRTAASNDEDEFFDWYMIENMEEYLKDKGLYKKYKRLLDKELKSFRDGEVEYNTISGGSVSESMSVLTGDMHFTVKNRGDKHGKMTADDKKKTDLDMMNDLAFVFNDVMGTYYTDFPIESEKGPLKSRTYDTTLDELLKNKNKIYKDIDSVAKEGRSLQLAFTQYKKDHPGATAQNDPEFSRQLTKLNELQTQLNDMKTERTKLDKNFAKAKEDKDISLAEEDLAKQYVAMYLSRYNCREENLAKGTDKYKAYMTRPQMRALIEKAKADFSPTLLINELLSDATGRSLYVDKFKETDQAKIQAHKKAIADACAIYFDAFVQHAEDNTVLNYEHFSGEYSKTAERTFDLITEAINRHHPVTAATFGMSTDNADINKETGEHTFDGISSDHEYIVLGTRLEYEGDKPIAYIRVRNPWGSTYADYEKDEKGNRHLVQHRDSYTDGISEIELNDFMARFDYVSCASMEDVED